MTFLNSEVERILGTILAESSPAPIIIVQADHGPSRGNHRMDIFSAYYFPEAAIRPCIRPSRRLTASG